MPTLNQISIETKTITKWGGIILGILFMLFILFKLGVFIKDTFYPTPPPPPTVGYDILNPIEFPDQEEKNFVYTLNTVTGKFPDFSDRAKIFKIAKAEPDLLALRKAKDKMYEAGFFQNPILIGQNVYKWTSDKPFSKAISYNILTLDFNLTSSFLSNENAASGKSFPLEETTITDVASSFFSNLNSFPEEEINLDRTIVNLFSIKNSVLIPATSISNAQAARVYFFQSNEDEKPIFYSNPKTSPINTLITGGDNQPQISEASYFYQKITNESETYPIKTAEQAFEELKEGRGYIASYPQNLTEISIKDVYVGYYIGDKKQNYLMPIIIFEGDNGFFAYVSAVTDEWINI